MAWPKLRSNKSPGHGVTSGNHSGAAPGGAQPHGPAAARAAGGPAAEPPPDSGPGPVVPGPVAPDEAGDTGSAPSFLDWGSQDAVEPDDLGEVSSGGGEDGTGPGPADPPKAPWKLVVTPVEPAGGEPPRPGIGERRGNVAHPAPNPSLRVKMTGAQRHTRRQLAKLGRAGYRAIHGNLIPESQEQIDHLVVGPTGVFAIDSEAWDKHLVVRTKNARQLWHGPFSMKERLEHARWESERASEMLSGAVGSPVTVRPAMAVYGPRIPWDVATIREVDVFSGPRLRKYLRRRARESGQPPLNDAQVERIYEAANQAFPHLTD